MKLPRPSVPSWWHRPVRWLDDRQQALIAAVADAFFPPAGPIPRSGTEAGVPVYFAAYLGRAEPLQRAMIRLLVAFVELGPLLFGPRRVPFTGLRQAERIQALEEMFASPIYFRRVAFTSMRALMTMAYLAHPEVTAAIGLRPDLDPFGLGAEAAGGSHPTGGAGGAGGVSGPGEAGDVAEAAAGTPDRGGA